jgi:hypothetical protein
MCPGSPDCDAHALRRAHENDAVVQGAIARHRYLRLFYALYKDILPERKPEFDYKRESKAECGKMDRRFPRSLHVQKTRIMPTPSSLFLC